MFMLFNRIFLLFVKIIEIGIQFIFNLYHARIYKYNRLVGDGNKDIKVNIYPK